MPYKLTSNPNYAGKKLYPVGQSIRVRVLKGLAPDMSASGALRTVSSPAPLGTATGRQLQPMTGTAPGWMEVTDTKGAAGWVRFDLLTKNTPTSVLSASSGEKAAQSLITDYIGRDVRIARQLASSAARLNILRQQGVSEAKLAPIIAKHQLLTNRLKERQQRLRSGKYLKVTKELDVLKEQFSASSIKRWFGISGIGLAPLAIGAIVVVGVAILVGVVTWQMAKDHYIGDAKQSEQDLASCPTIAANIEEVAKTDPAKAQKMREELNSMKAKNTAQGEATGKDAAEKEANTGPLAETGSLVKWVTIGFLAFKVLA